MAAKPPKWKKGLYCDQENSSRTAVDLPIYLPATPASSPSAAPSYDSNNPICGSLEVGVEQRSREMSASSALCGSSSALDMFMRTLVSAVLAGFLPSYCWSCRSLENLQEITLAR